MACPHCGEPALAGAAACLACGRSVLSMPSSRPARRGQSKAFASEDPSGEVLCKLCLGPCAANAPNRICNGCRGVSDTPRRAPPEEEFAAAEFLYRLGSKAFRPRVAGAKRNRLRPAAVAVAVAAVAVLVCLGVVVFDRGDQDPVERHLHHVRAEAIAWKIDVPADTVFGYVGELDVAVQRALVRNSYSGELEPVFDVHVRAEQRSDVALVDQADCRRLDVISECGVTSTSGSASLGDVSDARVYPWTGRNGRSWYGLTADAAPGRGEPAVAVRDVPPFLTLGAADAPPGELAPGTRWETAARLPFAAGDRGTLSDVAFRIGGVYLGRSIRHGYPCTVTRVDGHVDGEPDGALARFDRAHGSLRGVLFHSAETGLLVESHLFFDTSVWRQDNASIRERMDVSGTLTVTRR